jgi:hypothetical protein
MEAPDRGSTPDQVVMIDLEVIAEMDLDVEVTAHSNLADGILLDEDLGLDVLAGADVKPAGRCIPPALASLPVRGLLAQAPVASSYAERHGSQPQHCPPVTVPDIRTKTKDATIPTTTHTSRDTTLLATGPIGLFRAQHEAVLHGFANIRPRTTAERNTITAAAIYYTFCALLLDDVTRPRTRAEA